MVGCDEGGASGWRELCALKREDRVYAVATDARGSRVAVGGRDKVWCSRTAPRWRPRFVVKRRDPNATSRLSHHFQVAQVYEIVRGGGGFGAGATAHPICASVRAAFIYAIALTSDGSTLAVGSVDKAVVVLSVEVGGRFSLLLSSILSFALLSLLLLSSLSPAPRLLAPGWPAFDRWSSSHQGWLRLAAGPNRRYVYIYPYYIYK